MKKHLKKDAVLIPQYISVIIMCLIILVPIAILLIASFKTTPEFTKSSLFELPKKFILSNYQAVFERGNLLVAFKNTFVILVAATTINVVLGAMFAYVIARFEFKLKKLFIALVMGARVIPTITTQVAVFTIVKSLGLYNTIYAPIILYSCADVVQIILYVQFIKSVPYSLEESARIDGANQWTIFWKVVFPLLKPATITIIILKIVTIYNDMYIPYLYMPSSKLNVISTAIMKFCGSTYGSQVPALAAVFIVAMLPMLLIYIFAQKQLFAGITAGSVKE